MKSDIEQFFVDGKIDRRAYVDPEVFELERRQLFGRAWIYVGHESQAKNPGDFFAAEVAGQPLLIVRGDDGELRGFFNRCPHRGALIAKKPHGGARLLQCSYHGWCFDRQGKLASIPLMSGYDGSEVINSRDAYGLTPVPRFESYRGFLFASLAAHGPDLVAFLGPVAANLDNMVDRSPSGEIEVRGTPFRMLQRSNWKISLENLHDGAHALPTHISSIRSAQRIMDQSDSEWTRLVAAIVAANSQSPDTMAKLTVRCFPYGHSEMLGFRKTRTDTPEQREYEDALAARVGRDGVERILGMDRHNAIIYPSLSVQPNWAQLRVTVPISVNETRTDCWAFRLKGASDWVNKRILTFNNTVHTPASLIRADDLENYDRIQMGLAAEKVRWLSAHREIEKEPDPLGDSSAMSERSIRNQFQTWIDYMGKVH